MKLIWKTALGFTVIVGTIVGGATLVNLNKQARIAVGYKVKLTCSEVFVTGRKSEDVLADSFFGVDDALQSVGVEIDHITKSVSGSLFGLGRRTAAYREGFGCTVNDGSTLAQIAPSRTVSKTTKTTPYEVAIQGNVQAALMGFFPKSDASSPLIGRGAVVIKDGKIIAENYRLGFDKDTRQISWSVAKGIMQALVGIAVGDGSISLEDRNLMPQWHDEDPRQKITLGNLLHMASGLEFNELYSAENASDVATMLYGVGDTATFSASKPLNDAPGTVFSYSSGTANMISKILQARLTQDGVDYHNFPKARLFSKIGMQSAVFELDEVGTFMASSYVYATTRDFGRFGQLILQDGTWEGNRILPKGWVDYTMSPALGTNLSYGSQWFLNLNKKALPGLPKNASYLFGNEGQFIFIIPSEQLVIVRNGLLHGPASFEKDIVPVVENIYEAVSGLPTN